MQLILSHLRRACDTYKLIEDGDKIAVGVSGGKDSLVLLKALKELTRFSPNKFEVIAITIDMFSGKSDFSEISEWCAKNDIPHHIISSDIYSIVFEIRKEKSPCSLCSKLRRGMLCSSAKELGCNKLALGHTADDVVDTFFLSLLYEGRLNTILPKSYMSRSDITLIRPLILTKECDIKSVAKSLPVKKSGCPVDKHTQREYVRKLIHNVKKDIPDASESIFRAITSPERYGLFDKVERTIVDRNKDSDG